MVSKDGVAKIILLHMLAVVTVGTVAATVRYHRKNKRKPAKELSPTPLLRLNSLGRVQELERFSRYVARQMGFKDSSQCPQLGKLALDYLRKTNGYQEKIYSFFESEANAEALYVKLMEELEKCILGYFAFHWDQTTFMISQALRAENEPKRKLRHMVLEATRKQRFEKVTKVLKVTRVLSTLVEEMKAIGIPPGGESHLMIPVAHCDRSPVLLLMGGGMGAGKSTVLKEIMKEAFWSGAAANAVVVEADAFKETDVIYRAISSKGHHNDMLQTAESLQEGVVVATASIDSIKPVCIRNLMHKCYSMRSLMQGSRCNKPRGK